MTAQLDPDELKRAFEKAGQGQVFRYFGQLDSAGQKQLLEQAAMIDLEEIDLLVAKHVQGSGETAIDFDKLAPAPYIPLPEHGGEEEAWISAQGEGAKALSAGKIAAFVVAGGQGTRLGFDGPKGTFPVTPVTGKSLFQVFAEKIRRAEQRFGTTIPWYVMTSQINHNDTVAFFNEHQYFGLDPANLMFFKQGLMPAVDAEGKIILEAPDRIAMSPDGHGGSLRALVRSGATADMKKRGITSLSYFQVDNPLVRCIDAPFAGFHQLHQANMSSKMVPKAYPAEKVGHFCTLDDKIVVVEYSDMPGELTEQKEASGALTYNAGSIAIHMLEVAFIERMGGDTGENLPFHKAHKKIPYYDESRGETVKPSEPNGYKFEMFVFDALPMAESVVTVETARQDDFSPVKNAEGLDSPETAKNDQLRQFARWLQAAGETIEVDETGLPMIKIEISPLFASTASEFVEAWNNLAPGERPEIRDGAVIE
jgi:UDP-N-acetylglucosamine/UDP-N-acetylgalactosamine diphosphorylase